MKSISSLCTLFFVLCTFSFYSCQNSYTPVKMTKALQTLTKSKLLAQNEVEELVNSKKCKYLVKGRSYSAPIGLFAKNDVKNGAKGIDEWVQLDNGNAYVLINYKWVIADLYGSQQLQIEFDTLYCNE